MSTASRGRRYEWLVRDDLRAQGYEVLRMAGSKGALDLFAVKPGEALFVQVKGMAGGLGPAAWNRLYDLAQMIEAIPLLAEVLPRKPIAYYRLLTRKVGPGRQPYEPFLLDRVGEPQ